MLSRDEAAVCYLVAEDSLFCFVLTRDGLDLRSSSITRSELEGAIEELLSGGVQDLFTGDYTLLCLLHERLIQPLLPLLEGKSRLCIVPDGALNRLPFQALWDASSERYLAEDFALYSAPSLSTLDWLRRIGTYGRREILAFGNPVFDRMSSTGDTASLQGDLVSLPATEQEVLALEDVYRPNALVLNGQAASERNFKSRGGGYGVIHLATHSLLNAASPLYSSIALTAAEQEDGFLEAWEIMRQELNADIVVLSACETALGRLQEGEGMLGLTRAFFSAGVPSVVASLWSVEDRATRLLMERFHTGLRDGLRPAVALQQAQLFLLHETHYSNPAYWAPFVLIGDSE